MGNHFGAEDINKYRKFKKVDGATYRKVNQFLRKRTYVTAREWAIARLCTDFRTKSGAEMTFIGQHLPELVPFMRDVYTPQAVNQARNSFKKKVYKSGATFFYGAMCGFFTTDELDDLLFEASEVARFLLEVERTSLDIDEEIDIEDRITNVMRSVGEAAKVILRAREQREAAETIGAAEDGIDFDLPGGNERAAIRDDNGEVPVEHEEPDSAGAGNGAGGERTESPGVNGDSADNVAREELSGPPEERGGCGGEYPMDEQGRKETEVPQGRGGGSACESDIDEFARIPGDRTVSSRNRNNGSRFDERTHQGRVRGDDTGVPDEETKNLDQEGIGR